MKPCFKHKICSFFLSCIKRGVVKNEVSPEILRLEEFQSDKFRSAKKGNYSGSLQIKADYDILT